MGGGCGVALGDLGRGSRKRAVVGGFFFLAIAAALHCVSHLGQSRGRAAALLIFIQNMLGINYVTVGQGDTATMAETDSGAIEQEAMAEVPPGQTVETDKVNGDAEAPDAAQEGDAVTPAAEQSASSSAAPQRDLGFKKVFKLGGFKFTLNKDREDPPEPVTLLTVKDAKDNGDLNGKAEDESRRQVVQNGAEVAAAVQDPEERAGEAKEEEEAAAAAGANGNDAGDLAEGVHENGTKDGVAEAPASEPPAAGGFAAHVTTPLRKMFSNRLFAGLRRKSSKAEKDDKGGRPAEEPQAEPQPEPAVAVDEAAASSPQAEGEKESRDGELPEGNSTDASKEYVLGAIEKVTEALQKQAADADLNAVEVAAVISEQSVEQSAPVLEQRDETCSREIKPNEVQEQENGNCEQVERTAAVAEDSPIEQEPTPEAGAVPDSAPSGNGESTQDKVDASTGAGVSPEDATVHTSKTEDLEQDLTSPDKSKPQSSPLKKFFMGGPLKKLSMKRGKEKEKGDCKVHNEADGTGNAAAPQVDDRAASPSAIEVDSQDPPQSPTQAEAAGPSEEADGAAEKKRDGGITPWSSFKKLVKPKRRTKKNSESDEEPAEAGKTTTMSSTTSGVSAAKDDSVNSEMDEHVKEDGGKKKTEHLGPNWESLICIGSSKKRGRKSSDSDSSVHELQKHKGESPAQGDPESPATEPDQQFEDVNLEVVPKTAASKEEVAPEKDEVQSEQHKAEVAETPKNAVSWGSSLKRLVTPKKRNKSKDHDEHPGDKEDAENLENENGELQKTSNPDDAGSPSHAAPQHQESGHGGAHSTWSLKRFMPGKKKKSKVVAHEAEDAAQVAEVKSSDSDTDTPGVVPLAEYDDDEQPQQVQAAEKRAAVAAADGSGDVLASGAQVEAVSGDTGAGGASVQDTVAEEKADVGAADVNVEVREGEVDCSVVQADVLKIVEVGDEKSNLSAANEVVHAEQGESVRAEDTAAVASRAAIEIATEDIDATMQLTDATTNLVVGCSSEVSTASNVTSSVTCDTSEQISTDFHTVISETLEVTETSRTFTSVVSEETVVITSSSIQTPLELVETLNEQQQSAEQLAENVPQHSVVLQLPAEATDPEVAAVEQSQASSAENVTAERPPHDDHVGDDNAAIPSDVFVAHQLEQIPEDVNEVLQDETKGEVIVEAAEHAGGAAEDMAALIQKAVRAVVGGAEGEAQCGQLEQGLLPEAETPPPCDYAAAAASVVEAAIEAATVIVKQHTDACEAHGIAAVEVYPHDGDGHSVPGPDAEFVAVTSVESARVDAAQGVVEDHALQAVDASVQLESKEVGADENVQEIVAGHEDEADVQKQEQESASESVTDGKEQVVQCVENGFAVTPTEEAQEEVVQYSENVAGVAVSAQESSGDLQDDSGEAAVAEHAIGEPAACPRVVLQSAVDADANKDSVEEVESSKLEASVCHSTTVGDVALNSDASGQGETEDAEGVAAGNANAAEALLGEALAKQVTVEATIQEEKLSQEPAAFDGQQINPAEPAVPAASSSSPPAKETSDKPTTEPAAAL